MSPATYTVRRKSVNSQNNGSSDILQIEDLKMYFPVTRGLLRRKVADIKAIDGVSFNLRKGETLGLVGESGCGKTTVGRCILNDALPSELPFINGILKRRGLSQLVNWAALNLGNDATVALLDRIKALPVGPGELIR